jgi:hypothetical protein
MSSHLLSAFSQRRRDRIVVRVLAEAQRHRDAENDTDFLVLTEKDNERPVASRNDEPTTKKE